MAEFSDEELCRKVAGGDTQAYETLVERHQARAYRLACSILGSESDARDVSQDAFIRLYESAGKFDGRARFSTWFYRVLVNLCIDQKRRDKWWRRLIPLSGSDDDPDTPPIDPASEGPGPEDIAMLGQSASQLGAALERLSPNQRIAVLLQAQEGLSSREIAEVLKCSEATARVHIHRGLIQLRKLLKDE
ncbi:MAG TPA: RNA polymerase sigma factor [Candidatus Binataceae bacterium]|nr:RNA polymerase sigma factor [Candidatus Binataceae bacterium]